MTTSEMTSAGFPPTSVNYVAQADVFCPPVSHTCATGARKVPWSCHFVAFSATEPVDIAVIARQDSRIPINPGPTLLQGISICARRDLPLPLGLTGRSYELT